MSGAGPSVNGQSNNFLLRASDLIGGTISLSHAMFVDQKTEQVTVPLNVELDSEGRLELANSQSSSRVARLSVSFLI